MPFVFLQLGKAFWMDHFLHTHTHTLSLTWHKEDSVYAAFCVLQLGKTFWMDHIRHTHTLSLAWRKGDSAYEAFCFFALCQPHRKRTENAHGKRDPKMYITH